jgi:glucosamine--fructose-6-phosphate aminotransferase (isomerizing)
VVACDGVEAMAENGRLEFEPELRTGPPWAMEEMILGERELAPGLLASAEARRAGALIRSALSAGEPVVLTGCGTSEHAAMAGALLLNEALGRRAVIARDAFEASLEPQTGGVLVGISHEAGTAATLNALAAAGAGGARTILVTAAPELSPPAQLIVPTPLRDRSWCHTVGYLSPLLAVYAMSGPPAEPALTILDEAFDRRPRYAAGAAQLAACERLLIAGGGVDEVTGRELALKLEEGAHIPVTPLGLEKILHGHLAAADARTGLIVLRLDPRHGGARDRRARDVQAAADVLGIATITLHSSLQGIEPAAGALIAGALALQLLTLEFVLARGTNPDLIRREQPLYRAAAQAAENDTAGRGPEPG